MLAPKKDDKTPFAFWLVENFLPHDGGNEGEDGMSDSRFYSILALFAVMIALAGILLRGCIV